MYQGTTPEFSFSLPFSLGNIKSFLITFKQNDRMVNFTEEDVRVEDNIIYVKLTQEQTKIFLPNFKCKVQMRVKLQNDSVIASQIENIDINASLNSKVL